jgi:hypothetical protein
MKLSARQLDVLRKMADGWKLWHSTGWYTRTWLQNGGLGKGGETREVHLLTFEALSKRKLIRAVEYHVSESRYVITDAGRAALAEAEGGAR